MFHCELAHHLLAKSKGNATVIVSKFVDSALGIAPEQVAKETRVRNVRRPDDVFDLFEVFQFGREPTVHAEDLFVNYRADRQTVKHVGEDFPKFDRVPALALVVEAINSIDLRTLVVSSQQEEVLGVFDLIAEQESNGFYRLLAAVDVVAQEQVVCLRREPAVLENAQQVIVLAMHVA